MIIRLCFFMFFCPIILYSQIIFDNSFIKIETKIFTAEKAILWNITNKTDSMLVINAENARMRLDQNNYLINIGLTDLNGTPTFTEPNLLSVSYFKRIRPNEEYSYLIMIDTLDYNFKWNIDFQFYIRPLGMLIKDGIYNYQFRQAMCINEWLIYGLSLKLEIDEENNLDDCDEIFKIKSNTSYSNIINDCNEKNETKRGKKKFKNDFLLPEVGSVH